MVLKSLNKQDKMRKMHRTARWSVQTLQNWRNIPSFLCSGQKLQLFNAPLGLSNQNAVTVERLHLLPLHRWSIPIKAMLSNLLNQWQSNGWQTTVQINDKKRSLSQQREYALCVKSSSSISNKI